VSSFSKLQTCIQINKNTKGKRKTLFLLYKIIIKTENTLKKEKEKRKKFKKKLKHESNIVEITHLCIRHRVHTSMI
jgi:hypothetical protein